MFTAQMWCVGVNGNRLKTKRYDFMLTKDNTRKCFSAVKDVDLWHEGFHVQAPWLRG
jgi:hypothetical protein